MKVFQAALAVLMLIGLAEAQKAGEPLAKGQKFRRMTYSESPKESFYVQSEDVIEWNNTGKVGAILGFGAFAIAYVVTVVKIFVDIKKRYHMYSELVAEDLAKMKEMNMDNQME